MSLGCHNEFQSRPDSLHAYLEYSDSSEPSMRGSDTPSLIEPPLKWVANVFNRKTQIIVKFIDDSRGLRADGEIRKVGEVRVEGGLPYAGYRAGEKR